MENDFFCRIQGKYMAKIKKYYVVWQGLNPGIYNNWNDCKDQVRGQQNAKFKSFESREAAEEAFNNGYEHYIKSSPTYPGAKDPFKRMMQTETRLIGNPITNSLAVDAACSGNPGDMEYRGVYTASHQEIFHIGPLSKGTNNVGEFLALVHGLALLKQKNCNIPIYSDSRNAIAWVKKKKCKTLLEKVPENEPIFDLIARAEKWLQENTYTTPIYKWETAVWGEIPADFGRK